MLTIGLLPHPARPLDRSLEAIRRWVGEHGATLGQVDGHTGAPQVAPRIEVGACDVVVAIGGDGTVLAALRAAAPEGKPVLGVACGSLGVLTTVAPGDIPDALDRFVAGTLRAHDLPALELRDADDEVVVLAINDVVLVRRGTAQLTLEVYAGEERYVHIAGDGAIVATALGSSAYTMAAGGPLLFGLATGFVCTPLAMHGGGAPPLVLPPDAVLRLQARPGYGGYDLEVDGRRMEPRGDRYTVRLASGHATMVAPPEHEGMLAGLRRRGLLVDSPRVIARDRRDGPGGDEPT